MDVLVAAWMLAGVDMLTNLSTLLDDGDLAQVASGTEAVVLSTARYRDALVDLAPERDVDRAVAKLAQLAGTRLETAFKMDWCTRLTGYDDLFEIRVNGVRLYAGRVGRATADEAQVLVIVAASAEQKSGKSKADPAVLADAERQVVALRARCNQPAQQSGRLQLVSNTDKTPTKRKER